MSRLQRAIFSIGTAAVPVGLSWAIATALPVDDVGSPPAPSPIVSRPHPDATVGVLSEKAFQTAALARALGALQVAMLLAEEEQRSAAAPSAAEASSAFEELRRAVAALPRDGWANRSDQSDLLRVDRAIDRLRGALEDSGLMREGSVYTAFSDVYVLLYTEPQSSGAEAKADIPTTSTSTSTSTTHAAPDPRVADVAGLDTVNGVVGLFGAGLGAASAAMTLRAARLQPTPARPSGGGRPRRPAAGRRGLL